MTQSWLELKENFGIQTVSPVRQRENTKKLTNLLSPRSPLLLNGLNSPVKVSESPLKLERKTTVSQLNQKVNLGQSQSQPFIARKMSPMSTQPPSSLQNALKLPLLNLKSNSQGLNSTVGKSFFKGEEKRPSPNVASPSLKIKFSPKSNIVVSSFRH